LVQSATGAVAEDAGAFDVAVVVVEDALVDDSDGEQPGRLTAATPASTTAVPSRRAVRFTSGLPAVAKNGR
jgi:hypothetical protein